MSKSIYFDACLFFDMCLSMHRYPVMQHNFVTISRPKEFCRNFRCVFNRSFKDILLSGQKPNMSDITPQPEITTPTNSFTNAQHPPAFEDAFFETASTYSKYSIQDLLAGREPETSSRPTQAQSSYTNRSNSADTRASYGEGTRSDHVPANRQRNPYSKKPSNRPGQSYEYKSDVFREAIERGSDNLHVGDSSGNRLPREAETPSFDWSKFREEAGIVPPDSSQNNTRVISIECSDSDSDFSDL